MRTRYLAMVVFAAQLAGCTLNSSSALPGGSANTLQDVAALRDPAAYATTLKYVETFYPLWFTYQQWSISSVDKITGPVSMSPVYHAVVAPNDDTLYGNSGVDVSKQPVIFTIPKTRDSFSVLSTNAFGDVIDTGIDAAGTYAFTNSHWNGPLPGGATKIVMPTAFTGLIVRVDKYSGSGQDEKKEAERFRLALRIQPLAQYKKDPSGGKSELYPVLFFGIPFKTIADTLATQDGIKFLTQMQVAVASIYAPAFTDQERALSARFDSAFANYKQEPDVFTAATRKAHQEILDCYLQNTGKTHWVTFDNIGTTWTALQRSAIAEFIEFGNSHATAAYYQTFDDGTGAALDGAKHSYVLTFPKADIPQAKRFWSVTAYTPQSITLIRNPAKKYLVGSYTPGLRTGRNGSITIYLSPHQPAGAPSANWLPVPRGSFNIMLRVYGPEGRVEKNTYIPPPVIVSGN